MLRTAEDNGIDVLLTGDATLNYKQNLTGRRLAVVALSAIQLPIAAIDAAAPGSFQDVDCGTFHLEEAPRVKFPYFVGPLPTPTSTDFMHEGDRSRYPVAGYGFASKKAPISSKNLTRSAANLSSSPQPSKVFSFAVEKKRYVVIGIRARRDYL